MKKRLTKDQIFTIPNLLSTIRILLIPLIAYLYIVPAQYVWVAVLTAVSALTDILEGRIARGADGLHLEPVSARAVAVCALCCEGTVYAHLGRGAV